MAAHVQAETIPEAIRPGLTLRDALLNSSVFFGEYAVYRAWIAVKVIMKALKKRPIPVWVVSSQDIDKIIRGTHRRLTPADTNDECTNVKLNLQRTDAITRALGQNWFIGRRHGEVPIPKK